MEKRLPVLWAALCVGGVWAVWHLPYFFLPGNMHTQGNFFVYIITTVITGFILTAIYKLTKSVILCMLFHGWQNTIVMSIQSDMGNIGFIVFFVFIGTIAAIICCKKTDKSQKDAENINI